MPMIISSNHELGYGKTFLPKVKFYRFAKLRKMFSKTFVKEVLYAEKNLHTDNNIFHHGELNNRLHEQYRY